MDNKKINYEINNDNKKILLSFIDAVNKKDDKKAIIEIIKIMEYIINTLKKEYKKNPKDRNLNELIYINNFFIHNNDINDKIQQINTLTNNHYDWLTFDLDTAIEGLKENGLPQIKEYFETLLSEMEQNLLYFKKGLENL